LAEEQFVWSNNREKPIFIFNDQTLEYFLPESSVLGLVPRAEYASLSKLIHCNVVFPHVVLELMRVKLLHAGINECHHGSTGPKSKPIDETLTWFEAS
jgi:hypothetical protein